jgi:heme A synthase
MRVEGWLFVGCGIFLAGSDVVYWYLSYDPTGTTALALAVGLMLLVGFYVLFTGRRLPPRPEDNDIAEVADGAGEIGFFSPHSWWPLWLGLSGAVMFLGVAIGWWMVLIGLVAVIFATVGFVFEYYRGHFAH